MSTAANYPGTTTPIQVGDEVLWHNDGPGTVVFIISQNQWRSDFLEGKEWYIEKYGAGIMVDTTEAGLVLEPEDDPHIEFVRHPKVAQ